VIGQIWLHVPDSRKVLSKTIGKHEENQIGKHFDENLDHDMDPKLIEMKTWLTSIGSPHCRIDHASFQSLPMMVGGNTQPGSDILDQFYPCHIGFQIRPNYT